MRMNILTMQEMYSHVYVCRNGDCSINPVFATRTCTNIVFSFCLHALAYIYIYIEKSTLTYIVKATSTDKSTS